MRLINRENEMGETSVELESARTSAIPEELANYERALSDSLAAFQLPTEGVLVTVAQRVAVFRNLSQILEMIDLAERQRSLYLSKFIASVSSGLFDAALNYLWDETILQIRRRVVQYDIDYFFDNAVSGDRRKRLKGEDDLQNLSDYDLIKGSKEIGLVSEIGFKHLEYINYMRNWASAAHPNHNSITGLQLVAWLETCVKEVISLPLSNITIGIRKLLSDVRSTTLTSNGVEDIVVFFANLHPVQANNLASGFFGIYTSTVTESHSRVNIHRLLPQLWKHVDEEVKSSFGLKHSYYAANGFVEEKKLSREFLELVSGEKYISEELRIPELDAAIENFSMAHRSYNNFYNEPSFAKQLIRLVGEPGKLPRVLNRRFVLAIVEAFLTNGKGVAVHAEPLYSQLLSSLTSEQANIAVLSFTDVSISSRLQLDLCNKQFRRMLDLVRPSITSPPVIELVSMIDQFTSRLDGLKSDVQMRAKVDSLEILLR